MFYMLILIVWLLQVTSEADVKNALDIATEKFKKLDLLVNCAGVNVLEKIYDFRFEKPHSLENFTSMLKVCI